MRGRLEGPTVAKDKADALVHMTEQCEVDLTSGSPAPKAQVTSSGCFRSNSWSKEVVGIVLDDFFHIITRYLLTLSELYLSRFKSNRNKQEFDCSNGSSEIYSA